VPAAEGAGRSSGPAATPNADVYVVVPALDEATVLGAVLEELLATFPNVVVVDDGSRDGSAEIAHQAGAWVARHPMNLGQGAALRTGLEVALRFPDARYFVTFDSDGQHRVDDAVRMVDLLRHSDVQIVFGSRFLEPGSEPPSRAKRLLLRAARAYTNRRSGLRLTDAHNGLRAFDREVAQALELRFYGMAHASEIADIVGRRGFPYTEIPIDVLYTDYSVGKGQSMVNSINILFDLFWRR
jgi:polyprenyl-phospho-N-acetylgalactosaminyl synthase